MRLRLAARIAFYVLCWANTLPAFANDAPKGALNEVTIRLFRSPGLVQAPTYSVEIRGDGKVTYEGMDFVLLKGRHTSSISPDAVEKLLMAFKAADFWSLKDEYKADATDQPFTGIMVQVRNREKHLGDYWGESVGMPHSITNLEDEIDQAAGVERWTKGNEETVAALRKEQWDFHSQEAADAITSGIALAPEKIVFDLIDSGAPVNGSGAGSLGIKLGETPLAVASSTRKSALVDHLIALGALDGPHAKESWLKGAIASEDLETASKALKYGPNVNVQDENGDTPLMWVENRPDYPPTEGLQYYHLITAMLLAAGANPALQNKDGDTPLHKAHDDINVQAYLRAGAPLEARDRWGRTPLLSARQETALALIKAGADVHAVDNSGMNLLKTAKFFHWDKVTATLAKTPSP